LKETGTVPRETADSWRVMSRRYPCQKSIMLSVQCEKWQVSLTGLKHSHVTRQTAPQLLSQVLLCKQVHTGALLQPWGMVVYVNSIGNTASPHERMLQMASPQTAERSAV
jgi:hypothetical protein